MMSIGTKIDYREMGIKNAFEINIFRIKISGFMTDNIVFASDICGHIWKGFLVI